MNSIWPLKTPKKALDCFDNFSILFSHSFFSFFQEKDNDEFVHQGVQMNWW
jgi:hypothetical protein